ncbi:MAG: GH3 auxin-responsive promoter family protein [Microscillaceae bacterium]|nr:GH3 auxin-responsive promoter family protein [Microscillaceae bacterium]MDW8461853.1 GH3 auxin-responsive promoter family protein [Cytophagales bacterium]
MAIIGKLLKQGIRLRKSIEQEKKKPFDLQKKLLLQLLTTAKQTEFGKYYKFEKLIRYFGKTQPKEDFYKAFKETIPLFDYNKIFKEWWYKSLEGVPDVTWRGKTKYFALSSGTSEASSKHIPVTKDMIRAIQRTSIRQILSLSNYDNLPDSLFTSGMLMLGGSTHLNNKSTYFEGDLSGITASQIPFWFQHFYKPGKRIAKHTDWNTKLEEITLKAPKWNIGFIVGVPAWIQIMLERIIAHYNLKHIHEIWPNLLVYTHGGVSFEPYKKGFQKLLGKPLIYIETYLASEGFIAYQEYPNRNMRFVLNNGIFLEFVPFNEKNFNANGELNPNAETYMIHEIEENKDYAILLNTCAGAWRYLIGDTVRLTDRERSEMIITGRTKHFLSLCGEHLSVDNMNKAIELVNQELNLDIKEFTVVGIPYDTLFAHQWYVSCSEDIPEATIKACLDEKLKILNDDYRVERSAALKEIFVKKLPKEAFYDWMRAKGKEGGQNKFPRVLKEAQHTEWKEFISKYEMNK